MNSRLENKLSNIQNKKAFSPFIMAGYPDYATTLKVLHAVADAGVDFIELGMPFTDPSADGPTIQAAGTAALQAGATVKKTFELVREFRKTNTTTPLIWMGYYNPVYRYGVEAFCSDAVKAGIDGILLADLPPEEAIEITPHAEKHGLAMIYLITPATPLKRFDVILKNASGFLYYVSITGITGTQEAEAARIRSHVLEIKKHTSLPVMVGFGINTPEQAKSITSFADGVIVGSALIKQMTTSPKDKMVEDAKAFTARFVRGIASSC